MKHDLRTPAMALCLGQGGCGYPRQAAFVVGVSGPPEHRWRRSLSEGDAATAGTRQQSVRKAPARRAAAAMSKAASQALFVLVESFFTEYPPRQRLASRHTTQRPGRRHGDRFPRPHRYQPHQLRRHPRLPARRPAQVLQASCSQRSGPLGSHVCTGAAQPTWVISPRGVSIAPYIRACENDRQDASQQSGAMGREGEEECNIEQFWP